MTTAERIHQELVSKGLMSRSEVDDWANNVGRTPSESTVLEDDWDKLDIKRTDALNNRTYQEGFTEEERKAHERVWCLTTPTRWHNKPSGLTAYDLDRFIYLDWKFRRLEARWMSRLGQ